MADTITPMATMPNLEYVVQAVRDSRAWDFSTKEGLCEYGNAVVVALHATDPEFGHLRKTQNQTHCTDPAGNLCAVDVALYRPLGQIVDFISDAGPGSANSVTWQPGEVGEYSSALQWFAPVPGDGGGGEVPPEPVTPGIPEDVMEQLDRIEQTLAEQSQTLLEMKMFLSNMNEQIGLMAGVCNQLQAAQNPPLSGQMVLPGRTLTLNPQT